MGDSSGMSGKLDDSGALELTGKIMVVAVFILFLVVVFVFLLHFYAKCLRNRRREDSRINSTTGSRRNFDVAPGYQELNVVAALRRGLEPSVLQTIPVIVFSAKDFKDGLECAVCLSEVSEGEKTRLLPRCNHGFHVGCIDMWFQSHSTCPLCRNPISSSSSLSSGGPESSLEPVLQAPMHENTAVNGYSTEVRNFPTNVLFWGDETQVSTLGTSLEEGRQALNSSQPLASSHTSSSSSSASTSTSNRPDGMLVIDIPRPINEGDEPKSPMPTRFRSLKRLLSRDNRRVSPRSARDFDVEQQGDRAQS